MRVRFRKHAFPPSQRAFQIAVVGLAALGFTAALWAGSSLLRPPPPAEVIYVRAYAIPGVDGTNTSLRAVFEPSTIVVVKGTLVTLRVLNLGIDGEVCSFTLEGYGIDSGPIPDGGSWEVTFLADRAGVFAFYCEYHGPFMAGVLDVVEA